MVMLVRERKKKLCPKSNILRKERKERRKEEKSKVKYSTGPIQPPYIYASLIP